MTAVASVPECKRVNNPGHRVLPEHPSLTSKQCGIGTGASGSRDTRAGAPE